MSTDPGPDTRIRCPWAVDASGSTLYRDYHDFEWGTPLHGRDELFERICLEAFQAGLSWITVLRKREAFRAGFAGFDVEAVAGFDADDVARLTADPGIVRNRAKIDACIGNARAVLALTDTDLDSLLWSFAPEPRGRRLRSVGDVPAITVESTAMSRELKRRGFRFVGPTTAYALMQATGMVDDHLDECWVPRR
ncbi:DNA-3-methyladenine glycosylase I [Rhodococcus tukisamuensis]|uniref:DNA-3-methyladenine glycosylase I n=1 Tax=Rhodococcus tukisamuensis TaxID=168276 RepID=A0A1G7CNV8_9NOCA|nr:DNA-3-methyladenine glycosylase I [Rhodococcus tukisamuensis]SDE40903.1 DNA-3-methyladenine glycosylase I [Rhodococcus tukisamuensis]